MFKEKTTPLGVVFCDRSKCNLGLLAEELLVLVISCSLLVRESQYVRQTEQVPYQPIFVLLSKPELLLPFIYDYVQSATSFYRATNPDDTKFLDLQASLMTAVFKTDIIVQILFDHETEEIERLLQLFPYEPPDKQDQLIIDLEQQLPPQIVPIFQSYRLKSEVDKDIYYNLLLREVLINQPTKKLVTRGCQFEYDLLAARDEIVRVLNQPKEPIAQRSSLPPPPRASLPLTPPATNTQNPGIALAA